MVDELISRLSFHPGHPIWIAVGILLAVGYILGGVVVLLRAPKRLKWAWLIGAVLLATEFGITVWVQSRLDWNPEVAKSEVVGKWSQGLCSLELREDGSFRAKELDGAWALQGSALLLRPEPAEFHAPGFLRFGDELRLRPITGDPDDWAGELGLQREAH
jgi:hypothetical protein